MQAVSINLGSEHLQFAVNEMTVYSNVNQSFHQPEHKSRPHFFVNSLIKQPKIYIKINYVHLKALIDTGATLVSVISQNNLPNSCTVNKYPGKIFDLTISLNIIGISQISVELKNNIIVI